MAASGAPTRAQAGQMEKLRDAYAKETDPVKNKELAAAVQARALQTAQYGWVGQWYGPGAMRSNISGWS